MVVVVVGCWLLVIVVSVDHSLFLFVPFRLLLLLFTFLGRGSGCWLLVIVVGSCCRLLIVAAAVVVAVVVVAVVVVVVVVFCVLCCLLTVSLFSLLFSARCYLL